MGDEPAHPAAAQRNSAPGPSAPVPRCTLYTSEGLVSSTAAASPPPASLQAGGAGAGAGAA